MSTLDCADVVPIRLLCLAHGTNQLPFTGCNRKSHPAFLSSLLLLLLLLSPLAYRPKCLVSTGRSEFPLLYSPLHIRGLCMRLQENAKLPHLFLLYYLG